MRDGDRCRAVALRGAVALAVVSMVAAFTAATAMGVLHTASESTQVSALGTSGDTGTVSAKCSKRGSEAMSGGFDNPDFDPQFNLGPAILNYESFQAGPHMWAASGSNSGSDSGELVAYAYCDPRGPELKRKTKTVKVSPEAETKAIAKCGRGSEAVSGGLSTPDADVAFNSFASMRKGKRKWVVRVHEFSSRTPTLNANVYCDKREQGLKRRSKAVSVPPGGANTAIAKCPRGSEAVAGGFSNPGYTDPTGTGPAIYPYESRRASNKRKWKVSGWNGGSSASGTLVASAYCKQ